MATPRKVVDALGSLRRASSANVATLAFDGTVTSFNGSCSNSPATGKVNEGQLTPALLPGHRPLGLSRTAVVNALSTNHGSNVVPLRFKSSSGLSPFEGLKLQLPNNPFAPRTPRPAVQKLVLYRGRGMLLFRFIVRAKVFQLMGFLACAVFASVILTASQPDPVDLAAVGALAVGCVVTSYCIWYYSGRYVGEMSLLLPERRVVQFSVLDFWGNREDNDVPLERLVAPWHKRSIAEVRTQARQVLMPIEVAGDRQYYISVPHGHVLQKEVLQKLLYGAPLDDNPGADHASVVPQPETQEALTHGQEPSGLVSTDAPKPEAIQGQSENDPSVETKVESRRPQ